MSSDQLTADRRQIGVFVNAVFRYADPDTFVSLRAFRDDTEGVWSRELWSSPRVEECGLESIIKAASDLAGACARATERVVFAPPVATFKTGNGAAEKDIANGLELAVECDATPEAARSRLEDLLGPATVVVASGGIWTDPETGAVQPKLHLHWRLTEPTRQFAEHVRLKETRRLAKILVGADGSAVPLVHPLRWPGSWHRKAEARLARIVNLREVDLGLDEAFEGLSEAVAAMPQGAGMNGARYQHSPRSGGPSGTAEALDVVGALAIIPNENLDWAEWNGLGLATWRATAGSEPGFAAFCAWSAKSSKFDAAVTRARWDHYRTSPPNEIGAGTLFYKAREIQPDWVKPSDQAKKVARQPSTSATISEDALALEFSARHSGDLRYVALWGRWMQWAGSCWKFEDTLRAFDLARIVAREEARKIKDAKLAKAAVVAAIERLARADRQHAVEVDIWDIDSQMFNDPEEN